MIGSMKDSRSRSPSQTHNNIFVKQLQPDFITNPLEHIVRQQTFSKQHQTHTNFQIDSPSIQQRTPTMNQQRSYSKEIFQTQRRPLIQRPQIQFPKGDLTWPLFKLKNDPLVKQFWIRRTKEDMDRQWEFEDYLFKGIMLRIGRKKKKPKGYFYRLTYTGLLMYFKKESDSLPKGFLQLNHSMRVTVSQQKTKKCNALPMLLIEKVHGIAISLFDHQIEQTMHLFEALQEFCIVRGYDVCYEQLETLGSGAFACVYKVKRRSDGAVFAAKTYARQVFEENQHKEKFILMTYNEVAALKLVDHPGIIKIFEIFQEKDKAIIIIEFCAGGTLYQYVRSKNKLSEKHIAMIIKGILEALQELHRCNYVHRDLKLENIMLESKDHIVIKLVDFGFAEIINEFELISKSGTPGFLAPEVLRGSPYTQKGDIFSIGVVLYIIIAGYAPFRAPKAQQIVELNRKCQVSFDKQPWTEISQDLKFLVKKMMESKPEDRISIPDVLDSPFILHNTKQTSETNYQTLSNLKAMFSAIEMEKQLRQNSGRNSGDSGSSKHSKQFQLDFSLYTNDIKSLYQKNSIKTANSQKSNKSILMKGSSKNLYSKSVPRDVHLDDEEYSSLGMKRCKITFIRAKSYRLPPIEEFDSLTLAQQIYLKRTGLMFNKPKKPT